MAYLLVAEVDKIQSFIQRSARLKEVIGASYLLTTFCDTIPQELVPSPVSVLTSGGGAFRLIFADEDAAIRAGSHLRQLFAEHVGGSITIAEPVPYDLTDSDSERASISNGNAALRKAKGMGKSAEPVWHLPIHAICASCGVSLAQYFRTKYDDTQANYICNSCWERSETAQSVRHDLSKELRKRLETRTQRYVGVYKDPFDADTYAQGWDPRNYVAYIVADGNRMGALFGQCTPAQASQLSAAVSEVTQEALADAVVGMMHQLGEAHIEKMPLLPLIQGGDDLFVLIPAPWALDVARRFCESYQNNMTAIVHDLGIPMEDEFATVGAAVVVCKATYPYKVAHAHGEELLEAVKDCAKKCGESMFTVDLISGSHVVQTHKDENEKNEHKKNECEKCRLREMDEPSFLTINEGVDFVGWKHCLEDARLANSSRALLRDTLAAGESTKAILSRLAQRKAPGYEQAAAAYQALGDKGLFELFKLWDVANSLDVQRETV